MAGIFADTSYWIAVALPDDQWAPTVRAARSSMGKTQLVTTEEVLIEFLTALSSRGRYVRARGASLVRSILRDRDVTVVHQTHDSFLNGLDLYERRLDKQYSAVDCISMNTMKRLRIRQALTNDRHFAQEGFRVLIPLEP